jgi:glycosyltransferase involved in cell wall biosynthesis
MSREPLITTIVPTYRRPVLMKRAVLSVLNQSRQDFIVRILDNASGDETESVARDLVRMDPRIQYHRHPQNIGSLPNMVYGMAAVDTPFFNILCDDDLLMPTFLEKAMALHEQGGPEPAFVSTRVVALDERGVISTPFRHPDQRCTFAPRDGMPRCVNFGVSLVGVLYRSSAVRDIGPPRDAWWNWTESGWHALMALRSPIAFSPDPGAIMYNHLASGSKKMDRIEFKVSWFRMLADVRAAAAQAGVSDALWADVVPRRRSMFGSTCVRLSREPDTKAFQEFRAFAVRSGMNATAVAGALAITGAARRLGAGALLNGAVDGLFGWRGRPAPIAAADPAQARAMISSASNVLSRLNGLAGVTPHHA